MKFSSVHGLIYEGYEKGCKPIGVLGLDSINDVAPVLMAYHMAQNKVTIYTNGEDPARYRFQDNLQMVIARGCIVDTRKIRSLSRMHDNSVMIQFPTGATHYVSYILHTPNTKNRADKLFNQLQVEMSEPGGYALPKGPFGETNVRGCFVGGDTSTSNKNFNSALSTGMNPMLEELVFVDVGIFS